ncbi:MAG TPA: carbohydrate ABC transporter permease [Halanaerobiales bacterium]|nr:carbohydrate ABC transporter permease [Halanaerobiales bacterium]
MMENIIDSESRVYKFIKNIFSRKTVVSLARAILLIGISYIILLPLLTKISNSFMPVRELYDQTIKWIPRNFTLEHYEIVWRNMRYPTAFFNTVLLTSTVSILQLMSSTVIGYGLARFDFRGKNIIFALVIFTLIVPPQMIMTPLYLNFRFFDFFGILGERSLNLIGTYWPFILTSITGTGLKNGLFIYIMRQFFKGMPRELEEAAYIDGAGLIRAFIYVMLPGAVPGLIIVFLFAFVWQWNDYIFITMFMGGGAFLPQALEGVSNRVIQEVTGGSAASKMQGDQYESLINNTGMVMVITPLLILYAFMQKYFIESVSRSGIVG